MGSIDVLLALNTVKALWYFRMMSNTVLETTQIVTMDQLSGSVLTSVLSRTRALCIHLASCPILTLLPLFILVFILSILMA